MNKLDRKEKMIDMKLKGDSIIKIAKEFGITKQRVSQILKKKGVFMYVPDTHEIVKKGNK